MVLIFQKVGNILQKYMRIYWLLQLSFNCLTEYNSNWQKLNKNSAKFVIGKFSFFLGDLEGDLKGQNCWAKEVKKYQFSLRVKLNSLIQKYID
jgi:hypothetical protein